MKLLSNYFDDCMQFHHAIVQTLGSSMDSMFSMLHFFQILRTIQLCKSVNSCICSNPQCSKSVAYRGPAAGAKPLNLV